MKKRLVWNDIKENKLLAFSTWIFMAVSAFLFGLTCFLFVNLLGSIDTLMEKAQTPDFLQMHAGELQEEKLLQFVEEEESIQDYQTLTFLNMENGAIYLDGKSLSDSTQDNGVSVQSSRFDYLVDMENQIIEVQEGEIYVPACYLHEYDLQVGDEALLAGESFVIAGFLRDSQMNSMMASSKRFLVSGADYERLREAGSEEYLIEFLLKDGANVNVFSGEYADAGLPMNGPTITRSLIRLMNALSDGMLVLVILLVSVVMLLISMLCIRFTLLARMEEDKTEVGMLKAVGVGKKDLLGIYLAKYLVLSGAGAVIGLLMACLGKQPLQSGMQELYGPAQNGAVSFVATVVGVAVIQGILLWSIRRTLGRTQKLSAVEALTGRGDDKKNRRNLSWAFLVTLVIAAGVFLMVVPQNMYSTISSPKFVTYMGIGDGEIRLDIRQTDEIEEQTAQVEKMLAQDERIQSFTSLFTKSYRVMLPDGSGTNLNVELGDHRAFPVTYAEGKAPEKETEIALSNLCKEEFGVQTGDTLRLTVEGVEREFTVCGIYSDITNGGKTAKAAFEDNAAPVMWSVLYVTLQEGISGEQWISDYETGLSAANISAKVVNISDYVKATYGQTMKQIRMASWVAMLVAVVIMLTVVFLFVRLLIAKDRGDISLQKALGMTGREIMRRYGVKYLVLGAVGIFGGIVLGNLLGEGLAGSMLGSLGAAGFQFIINRTWIYVFIPMLAILVVLAAILMGLRKISEIKAYECCR